MEVRGSCWWDEGVEVAAAPVEFFFEDFLVFAGVSAEDPLDFLEDELRGAASSPTTTSSPGCSSEYDLDLLAQAAPLMMSITVQYVILMTDKITTKTTSLQ